mgnify:CR=1 FL=1
MTAKISENNFTTWEAYDDGTGQVFPADISFNFDSSLNSKAVLLFIAWREDEATFAGYSYSGSWTGLYELQNNVTQNSIHILVIYITNPGDGIFTINGAGPTPFQLRGVLGYYKLYNIDQYFLSPYINNLITQGTGTSSGTLSARRVGNYNLIMDMCIATNTPTLAMTGDTRTQSFNSTSGFSADRLRFASSYLLGNYDNTTDISWSISSSQDFIYVVVQVRGLYNYNVADIFIAPNIVGATEFKTADIYRH